MPDDTHIMHQVGIIILNIFDSELDSVRVYIYPAIYVPAQAAQFSSIVQTGLYANSDKSITSVPRPHLRSIVQHLSRAQAFVSIAPRKVHKMTNSQKPILAIVHMPTDQDAP